MEEDDILSFPPSYSTVQKLREKYPIGSRVQLLQMNDLYIHLPPALKGTVIYVDPVGTVIVNWDNGIRLGVVYLTDKIQRIHR